MLFGEARSRDHARACTVDVFLLFSAALSGCSGQEESVAPQEEIAPSNREFVTGPDGLPVDVPLLPFEFNFSDVGEDGPEPSIGVTSSGCIFFIALEKVMRSCDYGQTWEEVQGLNVHPQPVILTVGLTPLQTESLASR